MMKKLFTLYVLCALLAAPAIISAQTLIGSWQFNGNANDVSGNGLNGTVYNAILTSGQGGIANTAYQFNGNSAHIDVPYSSLLNLTTFTIQAMVKIDSFNPNTCQAEFIVNRGVQYASSPWYCMSTGDNVYDGSCSVYSPNNTQFVDGLTGTVTTSQHAGNYIQLSTWYCHTVTYDGSMMRLYMNGNLIDSAAITPNLNYTNPNTSQLALVFGYYPTGSTTGFPYWLNGAIDNVEIWSGALSSATVAAMDCGSHSIVISRPFIDTIKCAGSTLSLPFITTVGYGSTNTFTAQLSNSSGSFSNPTNIGSITSSTGGTINCTIPANTPGSNSYRIRIVASSPADTSADDGVNIHISSPGTTSFTNNLPVCVGDTIKLTASNTNSGAVYQWTDPNGTVTTVQNRIIPNAQASNAGRYAVSITNGACVEHDTLTAIVNPRPSALTTSSNSPVCAGSYIGLSTTTVTPGVTYSWSGPNGFTSNLQAPVINNVPLADSGKYYATVTLNGCSVKDSTHVSITPLPVITPTYINPVCVGDSIKINTTISAGSTFGWTGPGGSNGTNQNILIGNATSANAGNYILTATHNGCVTHDTITMVVAPVPVRPTISTNSPVCAGTNLSLSALSITGASYSWTGPNSYSVTGRVVNHTIGYADSGTYIVSAAVGSCVSHDTAHVSVIVAPLGVTYGSNSPICRGDTLKITASNQTSGVTYGWTGTGGFSSSQPNFNLLSATLPAADTFYLTVTYNTCVVRDTIIAAVNPIPTKPVVTTNSPVCAGSTLNMTAVSSAGSTYSWTGPGGWTSTQQNPSFNVMPPLAGTYIVTANLNGCKSYDTTQVTVSPSPIPFGHGNNTPICAGDTLKVTAMSMTGGVSFSWTGPNGLNVSQGNFNIPNATTANNGNYYLTASVGVCVAHDTMSVTIKPMPNNPVITSNSPVCSGNTLTLNSVATPGAFVLWGGPLGFYSLSSDTTRSSIALADSGMYTVSANLNGCIKADTIHVVVNPSPAGINYSSNSAICAGDTLKVTASSSSTGAGFAWSGPSGFNASVPTFNIPSTTTANSGNYTLVVTLGPCSISNTLPVTVKPLPNTPVAGSNSPVCINSALNLTSLSTTSGVSYSWTGPGGFTSATQNPVISSVSAANAGTYSVKATANGCNSSATTTVVVNPIPTGTINSNTPICAGNDLLLTSTVSPATATYSWSGPNGFTSTLQDPVINNSNTSETGLYNLTMSLGSCTNVLHTPVTITPIAGPPVVTITTLLDTICSGGLATFYATAVNAGTSPSYVWRINGIATGATGSIYNTTGLHNGDLVTCAVTSNAICQPINTAISNSIWMQVKLAQIPPVNIEVSPSVYNPGNLVTFTAVVQGSGNCLSFQWRVNGIDVAGATSSSYQSYTLRPTDKVSLFIHSSCSCTQPDTAVVYSDNLSVNGIAANANFKVYPNPAQDEITISGIAADAEMELYDISGKQIFSKTLQFNSGVAKIHLSLPSGVYMMKLTDESGNYFTDRLVIIK